MKESQNTEFRQSWHDDYLKWICGFVRLSSRKFTFKRLKCRFEQRVHKEVKNADLVSYGFMTKGGILTNAGALLADDCPIPQSRLFCWALSYPLADGSRRNGGGLYG